MKLNKQKKFIIIFVISLIITSVIIFYIAICNHKADDVISKQESQKTEKTQLVSDDSLERKEQIDEKMKSILAGVLKYTGEIEEKYDSEKINNIINDFNYHSGVFVSDRAISTIIHLLKETTNIDYSINTNGYLENSTNQETNEISKNMNNLIKGNQTIVIDYNPFYYCILGNDLCTFFLQDNDYMKKFKEDNMVIMILNPAKYEEEYESKNDLIKQIIDNVDN